MEFKNKLNVSITQTIVLIFLFPRSSCCNEAANIIGTLRKSEVVNRFIYCTSSDSRKLLSANSAKCTEQERNMFYGMLNTCSCNCV